MLEKKPEERYTMGLDRAAEGTQLHFLKVFVKTLIGRLANTTSILSQMGNLN